MKKHQLAAQLFTLREFLKTPDDVKETLKKVKTIGYDAVQVSGVGPIDPALLKTYADEAGLKICATHISADRLRNDLENVIKEHKLWGCEYVGLGSLPGNDALSREKVVAFAKEFSEIGRTLRKNDLYFIYHNHKFEYEKFDEQTCMDILFEETDPDAFGFELDTYWVQAGGANPVEWIEKVKGRMAVVHFKDMAIVKNEQIFAEIGQGNLQWEAILDACEKIDVKWYAVEQDVCRRNPFESLEISYKFLEKRFK